ncbi:MAG: chemotaxis response regulator protein-glutamate methylesterase [Thiotrichales bacterium]|jgi:two-component system chemotaxis response regulator CheB|nr:chemotaxis response regulator protein-glutamate methylesterase [Thiotrichales bacterium]
MVNKKIKVLVVDDSALVRQMLTEMLSRDAGIEVIGTAEDPFDAREKIKALNPDVVTLDIEMPKMDGVTFLRNLMRLHPLPVIMISSLTERGADVTLAALEAGAIDFVTKPKLNASASLADYAQEIIAKIKVAANVPVSRIEKHIVPAKSVSAATPVAKPVGMTTSVPPKLSADAILQFSNQRIERSKQSIIAIGASTGGTEAIREVLVALPANMPPIVITQHIPAAFSGPFAKRMDSMCALSVHEAEDGQVILPGHVYIAPGSHHLLMEVLGGKLVCRLNDGPAVNRHKPSVDVMFRSVSMVCGSNAYGVLLTGMGDDGARGLKELQDVGAKTIAQDEKSSIVWGMPGEAVKLGAADFILPLSEVAPKLLKLASVK